MKNKSLRFLAGRAVFLVTNRTALAAGRFAEAGELAAEVRRKPLPPVLVDMTVYRQLRAGGRGVRAAMRGARIRFMGTDGLRGRTAAGNPRLPLADLRRFVNDSLVTPGLVRLCGRAFGELVHTNGRTRDCTVTAGEDGRDGHGRRRLFPALVRGLREGGLDVRDLGVVPTPAVVMAMARFRTASGAMLTASHNPANQNGVKFFFRDRKLLPEGPMGDYALSALVYGLAAGHLESVRKPGRLIDCRAETGRAFVDFIAAHVKPRVKVPLVVDAAHGAASAFCRDVLRRCAAGPFALVNAAPDGTNINRDCGVASVEGSTGYAGKVPPAVMRSYPAVIRDLFRHGRRQGDTLGITLDGDADRGFLLVYRASADAIDVIDGDRCGFALAALLAGRNPDRRLFAGTVESDILLFRSVRRTFGLDVEITCVGDKWILAGSRPGRLLVGQEVSGHIVVPAAVPDAAGRPRTVLCGNGLLGMLLLAAHYGLRIPDYPAGCVRTLYTYNIDKNLFVKGSVQWRQDRALMTAAFRTAAAQGRFGPGTVFKVQARPDEPDLLYAGMFDAQGVPEAVIFVRKSGTENKIGTYLRGLKKHRAFLLRTGAAVNAGHKNIKDVRDPLYRAEQEVGAALAAGRPADARAIQARQDLSALDYQALISGMKKEGLVRPGDRV